MDVRWVNRATMALPLTHPANKEWLAGFRAWREATDGGHGRLSVYEPQSFDGSFVLPHPTWHSLNENIAFFHRQGVKGYLAMGTSDFPTLAMAEMRAWVMSSLMWDATRNATALMAEFIEAWYGPTAAPSVHEHMESWTSALASMNMTSGTCEVFSPGKPKDCHASTPAPANATDCATDCSPNPLLRYGGLGECGAACNNGHDLCTGPGCFCIYPENCL